MRNLTKLLASVLLIIWLNLFFISIVYAYQDLGSGSYFIQVILAAIFGVSFFLTKYWKKVKAFLNKVLKRKADPHDGKK